MSEHLIKLAERFGLPHKESDVTRRSFLKGLLATGVIVAAPSGLLLPREPKIHQVGGVVSSEFVGGVAKVRLPNGLEITINDFKESDKWDTVYIPSYENPWAYMTKFASTRTKEKR